MTDRDPLERLIGIVGMRSYPRGRFCRTARTSNQPIQPTAKGGARDNRGIGSRGRVFRYGPSTTGPRSAIPKMSRAIIFNDGKWWSRKFYVKNFEGDYDERIAL
jgi:hypothetical protein